MHWVEKLYDFRRSYSGRPTAGVALADTESWHESKSRLIIDFD
jgi:hypothetical protein